MNYLKSFIRFIKRPLYTFNYFKNINEVTKIKESSNTRQLGFVFDNGIWYVDLPEWELDRGHLMMVAGADTLLDLLSDYSRERVDVNIEVYESASDVVLELGNADVVLELIRTDIGGLSGSYRIHSTRYDLEELWLCPVVSFVFGKIPKYLVINLK